MPADLIFPEGSTPDGFLRSDLTGFIEDADTIIRELVQNGLDAARIGAKREIAEIEFSLIECSLQDLPAFDKYRTAFASAHKWRKERQNQLSSNEQGVIDRIQAVLDSGRCTMLMCRDNGIGLDQERMNDLMSESNSDKPDVGAGTSGVGHLTAFAASDLRYVLYAGRSKPSGKTQQDVGGGHAILAPYKDSTGKYSAHGYWMNQQADLFERSAVNFPIHAPKHLDQELNCLQGTGSVIGIAGFDCFRETNAGNAVEAIANAASVNFLVAITEGWLKINIGQPEKASEVLIDQDSIHARLMALSKTRARRKTGRLHRSEALRASETIRDGKLLTTADPSKIKLWVRLLNEGGKENTRVQVFRDGMWITSTAPELEPSDFGDHQKFDAVLSLTAGSDIYNLVRRSEGPEHRGIEKHRIEDSYDKLRKLARIIADTIRSHVPPVSSLGPVAPDDFAMVPLGARPIAEIVPEYDPYPVPGEVYVTTDGNGEDPSTDPDERRRTRNGSRNLSRPIVKPSFRVRTSVRPIINPDGTFRTIRAHIQLPSAGLHSGQKVSVSVRINAGSDSTADSPLRPKWQTIESIEYGDTYIAASREGAYAIDIPQDVSELTLHLLQPSRHPHSVELNVVPAKRSRA